MVRNTTEKQEKCKFSTNDEKKLEKPLTPTTHFITAEKRKIVAIEAK